MVAAQFNRFVTDKLLHGCLETLAELGVRSADVTVARVPGSFELPVVAARMARSNDAVVCLGAVIRGQTDHYEHVAGAASRGVADAALATGVPMGFGVLTTDTVDQALQRAGGDDGNAGSDAAAAAVQTAHLLRSLGH